MALKWKFQEETMSIIMSTAKEMGVNPSQAVDLLILKGKKPNEEREENNRRILLQTSRQEIQ